MNTRSGNVGSCSGVGGVSFVIGGIALLMLAVVRLESGGGNRPIPVPPDTAVPIPEPGFFGRSTVLYGVLPARGTPPGRAPTTGHRFRHPMSGDGRRCSGVAAPPSAARRREPQPLVTATFVMGGKPGILTSTCLVSSASGG